MPLQHAAISSEEAQRERYNELHPELSPVSALVPPVMLASL